MGGDLYLEIEGGGGSEEGRRGGAHRRWEGVVGRGGGAKYFFSGAKRPPSLKHPENPEVHDIQYFSLCPLWVCPLHLSKKTKGENRYSA